MTFFTRRGGKRRQRRRHAKCIQRGEIENGKTLWKIGRVLSAQRRTERLSYWILLAMLGLSSSICPNHFHDLTGRRFRFRSCVKRPRTSKRPIGFASQTTVQLFFSFVYSRRTHNSSCTEILFAMYLPCKSHRKKIFKKETGVSAILTKMSGCTPKCKI